MVELKTVQKKKRDHGRFIHHMLHILSKLRHDSQIRKTKKEREEQTPSRELNLYHSDVEPG